MFGFSSQISLCQKRTGISKFQSYLYIPKAKFEDLCILLQGNNKEYTGYSINRVVPPTYRWGRWQTFSLPHSVPLQCRMDAHDEVQVSQGKKKQLHALYNLGLVHKIYGFNIPLFIVLPQHSPERSELCGHKSGTKSMVFLPLHYLSSQFYYIPYQIHLHCSLANL